MDSSKAPRGVTSVGKGLNTCVDTLLERFKGGFALV